MSTNLFKVVVMNLPLDNNVIKKIEVTDDERSVIVNDKFTISHGDRYGTYEFNEKISEVLCSSVLVSSIEGIIENLRFVLLERIELGDVVVNEDGKRGRVIVTYSQFNLAEKPYNVLYEDKTLALAKSVRLSELSGKFKKVY